MSKNGHAAATPNVWFESPVLDYSHCRGDRDAVSANRLSAFDSTSVVDTKIELYFAMQSDKPSK